MVGTAERRRVDRCRAPAAGRGRPDHGRPTARPERDALAECSSQIRKQVRPDPRFFLADAVLVSRLGGGASGPSGAGALQTRGGTRPVPGSPGRISTLMCAPGAAGRRRPRRVRRSPADPGRGRAPQRRRVGGHDGAGAALQQGRDGAQPDGPAADDHRGGAGPRLRTGDVPEADGQRLGEGGQGQVQGVRHREQGLRLDDDPFAETPGEGVAVADGTDDPAGVEGPGQGDHPGAGGGTARAGAVGEDPAGELVAHDQGTGRVEEEAGGAAVQGGPEELGGVGDRAEAGTADAAGLGGHQRLPGSRTPPRASMYATRSSTPNSDCCRAASRVSAGWTGVTSRQLRRSARRPASAQARSWAAQLVSSVAKPAGSAAASESTPAP